MHLRPPPAHLLFPRPPTPGSPKLNKPIVLYVRTCSKERGTHVTLKGVFFPVAFGQKKVATDGLFFPLPRPYFSPPLLLPAEAKPERERKTKQEGKQNKKEVPSLLHPFLRIYCTQSLWQPNRVLSIYPSILSEIHSSQPPPVSPFTLYAWDEGDGWDLGCRVGDSLAVAALEPRKRRGKGGADIEPFVFVVLTDSIAKKNIICHLFRTTGQKGSEAKQCSTKTGKHSCRAVKKNLAIYCSIAERGIRHGPERTKTRQEVSANITTPFRRTANRRSVATSVSVGLRILRMSTVRRTVLSSSVVFSAF